MIGPAPVADAPPDRLAAQFEEAAHLMQMHMAGDALAIMNASGLTLPQLVTLHILRMRGPHTVSEIAERTRLSRAATSHLVDRLVGQGLVERAEDAADRRQKRVSLSPAGVALTERLLDARKEGMRVALSHLSESTRQRLAGCLEAVIEDLRCPDGGSGTGPKEDGR